MKALTISQPYASLIASGEKWVENRCWETKYRGPLAIHAGKGTQYLTRRELAGYSTGCIVAVAELVACVHLDKIRMMAEIKPKSIVPGTDRPGMERFWSEIQRHQHTEGPWCWVLSDIKQLCEPIRCNGMQGMWDDCGIVAAAISGDRHPLFDRLDRQQRQRELIP